MVPDSIQAIVAALKGQPPHGIDQGMVINPLQISPDTSASNQDILPPTWMQRQMGMSNDPGNIWDEHGNIVDYAFPKGGPQ